MEVENHRDPSAPRPAHELQADRVSAIRQNHLGPEPIQHLVKQIEEDRPFTRPRRPLGSAVCRRHQGEPHSIERKVKNLGLAAPAERSPNARSRPLNRRQHILERSLILIVEHAT